MFFDPGVQPNWGELGMMVLQWLGWMIDDG